MGSVIFKRPPLKKLKKEGLFGVDLHFHTRYSLDAISRIPAAVKKAQKKGFGFAITDHNNIQGVIHSYRLRKHALIIPGIEVTCRNGNHILAYFYHHNELEEFFDKELKPRMAANPFFIDISVEEMLQISKDYNCLICAPHPYAPGAVGMMHTGLSKKAEKSLKMVEVINGYNFRNSNMSAVYWATKTDKCITGGSDAHSTYELGKVMTFTEGNDIDSVFKDVLKNKAIVIGKEDNIFLKTVMGIQKESTYVRRSSEQKKGRQLLKSQLGTEYKYMRERFRSAKAYKMLTHHHEDSIWRDKRTKRSS